MIKPFKNWVAWFKELRRIVKEYGRFVKWVEGNDRWYVARLKEAADLIKDRTNIGVDVGFRDASHVIVIGQYRGRDYIQSYNMPEPDLASLIDHLDQMRKNYD